MTTSTAARAVFFAGPRQVDVRRVDVPAPRSDEVLIRTAFSGISAGTEMLAYRGEIDSDVVLDEKIESLSDTFAYPFQYGYSCVGTVEQSDADLAEGALVFALHPHQEYFVASKGGLVELPEISPRIATLFPLVETALQISLDAGPLLGRQVVVLGLGAIGMLTALVLQRSGAHVIASEPSEWRRATAAGVGIDSVSPEEVAATVRRISGGNGMPIVIEASGNPKALAPALPLLAHEGTAIVASWYGSKLVELPLGRDFHRRRLVLRSTQVSTIPAWMSSEWTVERRRSVAAQLLTELPLAALATHEFDIDDAPHAYDAVDKGQTGLVHAALRYM